MLRINETLELSFIYSRFLMALSFQSSYQDNQLDEKNCKGISAVKTHRDLYS